MTDASPRQRAFYRSLYFQVIVAIVVGILLGHYWPAYGAAMKPLGDGFIKLVKMIIAPVIFLTVVHGVAGIGEMRRLGSVAGKALVYFIAVSTLALIVGLIVANVVRPGDGMNIDPASLNAAAVAEYSTKAKDTSIVAFLLNIIPSTFIGAFASGEILQVLFIAILVGIAISLVGAPAAPVVALLESLTTVIFRAVAILMRAAPVGAFGAMAFTIGRYGLDSLIGLGLLIGTFYVTSALFVVVVLGAISNAAGFSVFRLIGYLKEEILLVLGTSSSESALPGLIDKMTRAGCPRAVVGMVVSTGYSFNLDGTNIYMTLAALFIAQATGVELPLGDQILLLLVAMISSKGAAGVTGAGFITLAATLAMFPAVPVAGMALILGIDRFMSECRSITNFIGNAVAVVVVSKWERGVDAAELDAALHGRPATVN